MFGVFYSCTSRKLIIKPLYPFKQHDTITPGPTSNAANEVIFKYFFVENGDPEDSSKIKEIQEFSNRHLDENYAQYQQYHISFYKKTNILNENYSSTTNDEIAWDQKDLCAEMTSFRGHLSFEIYDDWKCLNCDDYIKIE